MSRPFKRDKVVLIPKRLLLGLVLLLSAPFVTAQNNVGELLDGGAKKLSAEEFRQDVVQRTVVGPSQSGWRLELMYANSGTIQGRAEVLTVAGGAGGSAIAPLDGVWNIDESGRTCASIVVGRIFLPFRCEFWFKYKDDYFLAVSEDRNAKVLRRTVKQ